MQKRSISEAEGITKCDESLRIFSEAKHVGECVISSYSRYHTKNMNSV